MAPTDRRGGRGGEREHAGVEEAIDGYGAVVMGRNMFGGGPGPWGDDPPWTGWWGEDPPYHTPVFVLTHHARDPVEMRGGTTFHFVTDGIESALDRAKPAAGSANVLVGGGPDTVQQALAAGLVDEFELHVVPVVLGDGERLLHRIGAPELEQIRVVEAPGGDPPAVPGRALNPRRLPVRLPAPARRARSRRDMVRGARTAG